MEIIDLKFSAVLRLLARERIQKGLRICKTIKLELAPLYPVIICRVSLTRAAGKEICRYSLKESLYVWFENVKKIGDSIVRAAASKITTPGSKKSISTKSSFHNTFSFFSTPLPSETYSAVSNFEEERMFKSSPVSNDTRNK